MKLVSALGGPGRALVVRLFLCIGALVPSTAFPRPLLSSSRAELIAPLDAAVVAETGLRFAWKPAPGAREHYLLLSSAAFETQGWTRLPSGADIQVIRVERPIVAWSDLGRPLAEDSHLWWAAAGVDPTTGRVTFSEVRSAELLKKFSVRAEASPLVSVSPIGRTDPPRGGPGRIHLAAGFDLDPALGEPELPAALRATADRVEGHRSYIVYWGNGSAEETRSSILAAGGNVVCCLPDRAFLVRMGARDELSLAAPGAWVGAYQPAYKLSPRLVREALARQTVSVLLFPDADLGASEQAARSAGAEVLLASDNGINKILRLGLARPAIEALARDADVAWIEPWVANEALNDQAQGIVQTGAVGNRRLWDLGIRGEGQVVMTTDSGLNTTHFEFRDPQWPISDYGDYPFHRKLIAYRAGSSDPGVAFGDHTYHGTHTACTVAGNDDPLSNSTRDGMAKDAKLWFADLSGPSLGNLMVPPADLNDLYQPGYTGNDGGAARIASNSWGGGAGGAYTLDCFTVDQFMWNHPDFLVFFSNGNSGSSGPGSVASPAAAKNCVSVGAVGNGASLNLYSTYSSQGPTGDGRRKPTLCSPGTNVVSATVDSATFTSNSGTSMASPSAAGCAALIRQYVTDGWYPTGTKVPANGFTPSAALLKAMCIASCDNTISPYPSLAPENHVGWGRIDADRVLYFAGDTRRLLLLDQSSGLGDGQAIEYQVNVADASIPLEVTLVWTDYPGSPVASVQLVNDLDLTVSSGAATYLGNKIVNGVSQTGGERDTVNVEEAVRITGPSLGIWTVRVSGTRVPVGPQGFGLVVTGGLGTTSGTLALDRPAYGSASTVLLHLADTNVGTSASVTIASDSEPAGETVTLSGGDGSLDGSIPLSPFAGTAGDGVLRVSNGDVVAATYHDASPSATVIAQATVDLEPPTIAEVHALAAGTGNVLVTWETGSSADSRVYYGPTSELGEATPLDPIAVLDHGVTLTGLAIGQTYNFDVESRDLQGNVTRDDNGGTHYAFTAGPHADVLLVYDGFLFERPDRYDESFAATGWSYDVWQDDRSETPQLGDSQTGLRSYAAVWWQNGLEHYPPFSDAARESITAYLDGGGRLAVIGHDIVWANQDQGSPYYTEERNEWIAYTLHARFLDDPLDWNGVRGVDGDPISGAYTGYVPYTPHRTGAAGDEIAANPLSGSSSYDWYSQDGTPNFCGLRWESGGPLGTSGVGVWGGYPSRIAAMYFEWSGMDDENTPSPTRNDVLDKTLIWLIGRRHPDVSVVAPAASEFFDGGTIQIDWLEATFGGTTVQNRTLEYSPDGGQSWITIATGVGPSPYLWDITGIANSSEAVVRVRISDSGTPTLSGVDASDGVFAIVRGGNDPQGPTVVAGSVNSDPNPIDNQQAAVLEAVVTDERAGGSGVTRAEWSFGDIPAAAGSGLPMTGAIGTSTVHVSAALNTAAFAPGLHRLWVRGRDAFGNWGPAGSLEVAVNGPGPLAAEVLPRDYGLGPGSPNPARSRSTITYALPERGDVDLAVFDVTGRRVRSLVHGERGAGSHRVDWDLRDESGDLVRAGVYYYRLAAAGRMFTRRLVALN